MKGVFSSAIYTETEAINVLWKLICTGFIFLMVVGFTLLEYGGVRRKNSKTVLAKNVLVISIAAVGWWFTGYGLSYAEVEMFMGSNVWYFSSFGFERMRED